MNNDSRETDSNDMTNTSEDDALISNLDSLRQEYISQPDNDETEFPAPKQNIQIYFDKRQRLKILFSLVVASIALLSVLVVVSGAWSRYSATLSNDVTFEEVPAALEQELEPEPIPTDSDFELPAAGPDYDLPLPGEYSLPEVTPWPTPELPAP